MKKSIGKGNRRCSVVKAVAIPVMIGISTYNSAGQLTDYKFYIYSGNELWITIEECIAKGQLLTQENYSYPTAYQKK